MSENVDIAMTVDIGRRVVVEFAAHEEERPL